MLLEKLSGSHENNRHMSLTKTLKHLEKSGMIYRHALPTVPVTVEYSLTDKGQDFQSILEEIRDWGQKWEKENSSNSTK